MDIMKLRLRGAIGMKKGCGIDEIELDFSDMNGMVAISGPTGAGKSTVLEALQPYPQLISRPHPALIRHFYLRDSIKQLKFIHNGDLWDTVVKIDPEAGRCEGYIYVNGSSKSLNDGKISTYKEIIVREFGSIDLFTNSVFAPQNGIKMSSMQPGDLKALFSEFLGKRLAILVDQEDTAKQCSNILLGTMEGIRKDIDKQNDIVQTHFDASSALVRAESGIQVLTKRVGDHDQIILDLDADMSKASKVALQQDIFLKQIDTSGNSVLAIRKEMLEVLEDKARDQSRLSKDIMECNTEIIKNEEVLGDKESIEGAVDREKKLSARLAELKVEKIDTNGQLIVSREMLLEKKDEDHAQTINETSSLEATRDLYRTNDQHLKDIKQEILAIDVNMAGLNNDPNLDKMDLMLKTAKEYAEGLEQRGTVTCKEDSHEGGTFDCNSDDCPFVARALQAKKDVPNIEAEITEKKEQNRQQAVICEAQARVKDKEKRNATIAKADAERSGKERASDYRKVQAERAAGIQRLGEQNQLIDAGLKRILTNIERIKIEIEEAKSLSAKLPEIKIAESKLQGLKKARSTLDENMKSVSSGYDTRIDSKNQKIFEIQTGIDELHKKIDLEIQDKITKVESKINNEKYSLGVTRDELKEQETQIVLLKQNVTTADAAAMELKSLTVRASFISGHQSDWAYLQQKCGANGLRALEIDSVAPSITHGANALLEKAFGPWAMVDFQTLDDNGKEVLRPMIIDKDGEKVLVSNQSGGQQVYSMKAIRLAMTGVSKEKSGFDYKTAYCDEDDSGLDLATAQSFTLLYRAFLEQGGFNKVFYISHKPDCVALADHIITLGPGGVQP